MTSFDAPARQAHMSAGSDIVPVVAGQPRERSTSGWHGIWLSVFGVEALFKGDDLGHQIGALVLGMLFTALVITEQRSVRKPPYHEQD